MDQLTVPTKESVPARAPSPQGRRPCLPRWRVLLHNDDVHEMGYVTQTLCDVTSMPLAHAFLAMLTAHRQGVAEVLESQREYAELIAEQLVSAGLTSSVEPAEE